MTRIFGPVCLAVLVLLSGAGFADEEAETAVAETTETEETAATDADSAGDAEAAPRRPTRPPAPDVLVVREEYDNRCSEIAFRMALEPAALTLGELERLTDCIKALRGGASVTANNPQLLCGQYCGAAAPAPAAPACPPPPRPNLDALCPEYLEQQRQQRSDDRRQRQVRPHIPGL